MNSPCRSMQLPLVLLTALFLGSCANAPDRRAAQRETSGDEQPAGPRAQRPRVVAGTGAVEASGVGYSSAAGSPRDESAGRTQPTKDSPQYALLSEGSANVQSPPAPTVAIAGEQETPARTEKGKEGKGPTDPGGALRFRRLQMQDERGEIPLDGWEKAREQVKLMKAAKDKRLQALRLLGAEPTPGTQAAGIEPNSWTSLGPGNIGGRIRAIAIHPTNTNIMWVGSVSGGIWVTFNGESALASWSPVDDFMANLSVTGIVINPVTPDVMYAATGEGFGNIDAIRGAGIFRSTDGGATWNQLPATAFNGGIPPAPNPNFFFVNRLAISPNGANLLAVTSPAFDAAGNLLSNGGIWISTDAGTTWTQEANGQGFDVDFQPGSNTQAVVGGEGGARFRTISAFGVATWTAATFTPPIAAQPATNARSRRVEVAYAPNTPATVYALVNQHQGAGAYQGEVYRSTDGGQNFTRVHTGTNFFNGGGGNQGWYDNVIWVNPQDASFIIVGGIHLWRSTNSGASFTQISDGSLDGAGIPRSPHADHHVIVAHPGFNNTSNQRVFFGNDGGIYRTDIVGTANTFQGYVELNNQLGITQFYGAAGNATSGVIVGGTQDNGTIRFTGGTEGWLFTDRNDGGFCAADPTDPRFTYGETQNLGVHRSIDGGISVTITAGLADAGVAGATNFIAPLVLDPNEPNTLLAGGISLWRCNNAKSATPTWSSIKAAAPGNAISAIVVSPTNSDFIVVGHNNGDIFLTLNGTNSPPAWSKIDAAVLPNGRMVTRLVIDPNRGPNWIYVTFGGFSGDNIYRTADFGATWVDVTGAGATGLPNVPVRTLVFHPTDANLLYAGTEIGIFTSENAGATWEPSQDGPANVSVDELFWMGGDLIAATHGRGLYRASGGIYVDKNYVGPENGSFFQPFNTVTEGKNAATSYRAIWIRPGTYNEPITINNFNGLELRALGGPVTIGSP